MDEQARARDLAAGDDVSTPPTVNSEATGVSPRTPRDAVHAWLAPLKQRFADFTEWTRASTPRLSNDLRPAAIRGARLLLRLLMAVALAYMVAVLSLIVVYRWINPPASALMLGQRLAGQDIAQQWVPLSRISRYLPLAVINSEDGQFCHHHGVDWGEIGAALDTDGPPRGGSTISMQVVKNLFLWPQRSYIRKAIEIPLAYVIELAWSKRRILEIYLNIAEWGPGIFGAEAAARYHFRKPASVLTARESALLAVSLPNPYTRRAGNPGPRALRLAQRLMLLMGTARGRTSCLRPRHNHE